MTRLIALALLLTTTFPLWSSEEASPIDVEGAARLIFQGEADSFVHGCVHTESGTLFLGQTDLFMSGVDGLSLNRYYDHGRFTNDEFGIGSTGNYPVKGSAIESCKKHRHIWIEEPSGGYTRYTAKSKGRKTLFKKTKEILQRQNNLGAGEISARTHPKNDRWMALSDATGVFMGGSGVRRFYEAFKSKGTTRFHVDHEETLSGNSKHYTYDKKGNWKQVVLKDPAGKTLRWLKLTEETPLHRICRASNGKEVHYHYTKKKSYPYLTVLKTSDFPETRYEYERMNRASIK